MPTSLGPRITGLVDGWVFNGVQLASALLVYIYGRRRLDERRAWTVIALGIAVWCFGNIWWSVFLRADVIILPPSVPDSFWLLSYPILFVGVVKLLRCRLGGSVSQVALLDGAIAGSAISAVVATFALDTIWSNSSGSPIEIFFGVIYPILDVVLLGLIAGMASAVGRSVLRTMWTLIVGLAIFATADTAYYFRAAIEEPGSRGWDTLWTIGLAILAFAPLAGRPKKQPTDIRSGSLVSVLSGLSSLVVLVFGNFYPVGIAAVGCATVTVLLSLIRVASSLQHHQLLLTAQRSAASTDALTGLANRRQFMTDLADRSAHRHPALMVMIDLDGFKQFNDDNGHMGGDELLVRFSRRASDNLGDRATLYRLGGDEFCALVDLASSSDRLILENTLETTSNQPDDDSIAFSYGTASLWVDADTIEELLRLSDQRLYAHKRSRKAQMQEGTAAAVLATSE